MSAAWARVLTLAGAVAVLGWVDHEVWHKERIRREGQVIYLRLGTVDPRSLMQGDYMALRFALADSIARHDGTAPQPPGPRYAPLQLDPRGVATLADDGAATLRLRYRIRQGRVWIGTNAYFFEEGTAQEYSQARYGEFRLDPATGEAVLVGVCDEQLRPL